MALDMSVHAQLVARIVAARPNAVWNLDGDTYAGLTWLDQVQTKPTPQELGL